MNPKLLSSGHGSYLLNDVEGASFNRIVAVPGSTCTRHHPSMVQTDRSSELTGSGEPGCDDMLPLKRNSNDLPQVIEGRLDMVSIQQIVVGLSTVTDQTSS
jgi:hypothetical protein